MNTKEQNQVLFLQWLSMRHPDLFHAAMPEVTSARMGGFLDTIVSGVSSLINTASQVLPNLATQYVQSKSQLALLDTNLKRAQQGLGPVDALPSAQTTQPQYIQQPSFMSQIPPWIWPVGVGAILYFLVRK